MKYRTEYVIGKKTAKDWSGVYGYKPDNSEESRNLGVMYAVARISTDSKTFSSEKFAKLIFDELQQAYFVDLEISGKLKRLEEACWKMKARMDLILSRESELAESGIDMEMAITVFVDSYLYVVTIGESFVVIEREGHVVNISEALEDTNRSGFIRSGSLEISETDKFLLATSHSFKSEEESAEILDKLTIDLFDGKQKEGVSIMLVADESMDWDAGVIIEEPEESIDLVETEIPIASIEEEEELPNVVEQDMVSGSEFTEEDLIASNSEFNSEDMAEQQNEEESETEDYVDEDIDEVESNSDEDYEEHPSTSKIGSFLDTGKSFLSKGKSAAVSRYESIREGGSESDENSDLDVDDENKSPFGSIFHFFKNLFLKIRNHFRNNQTTYAYYLKNFFGKFRLLFENFSKWFRRNIIGKPEDRRFLNNRELKRNRWLFLIVIVVASVFLYTQVRAMQNRAAENQRVEEAQQMLEQFTERYGTIADAVTAAQFNESSNKAEILSEITNLEGSITNHQNATGLFAAEHNNLLTNLSLQEDKLLLKERIGDDTILIDVAKSYQGVDLTDIEENGDRIFIADAGQNAVYAMNKSGNGDLDIHISNVSEPFLLVDNKLGEIIVYDKTSENSISKFDPNTIESLSRLPNTSLDTVGSPQEVAVYEGNNALYELRLNFQQIFKRERVGAEYAGGGAVFETANPPSWKVDTELENAVDIEAPFELYALVTNLGVRRYLGGGQNQIDFETFTNFTLNDFEMLKEGAALDVVNFGGTDSSGMMVVGVNGSETTEGRVYLFDIVGEGKQFKFRKQFVSDTSSTLLNNIKEVQVDPVNNIIFVLDGNKVLRFDV